MTSLIRYDAARAALAEARSIDEVKDILDKAEALRVYARLADDITLEMDAAEIRLRAERRFGQLKSEMDAAGLIHKGGRPSKKTGSSEEPVSEGIRLADLGVDKKLSARAGKLGGIAERAFEGMVERMRDQMAAGNRRVSLDLIKEDEAEAERKKRAERQYLGGSVADLQTLIAEGRKFGAVLADPPWHFKTRSDKGDGRSAGKHYKTEKSAYLDKLKALPIEALAADKCVLFMWMLDWCPQDALDLIEAWGFEHKTTAFTWVKQTKDEKGYAFGQGYWTRANPEDNWLATRGHPKRLHADVRQLVLAPIMEHSRKPDIIHDHIERLVDGPYLELFARRTRDKWQTWGNELAFKMLDIEHSVDVTEMVDPETGEIIETAGEATAEPAIPAEQSDRRSDADRPTASLRNAGGGHEVAPDVSAKSKLKAAEAGEGDRAPASVRDIEIHETSPSADSAGALVAPPVSPTPAVAGGEAHVPQPGEVMPGPPTAGVPAVTDEREPSHAGGAARSLGLEVRTAEGGSTSVPPSAPDRAATLAKLRASMSSPAPSSLPDMPDFLERVALSKTHLTILTRIRTEECDRDEQDFVDALRKDTSGATVADCTRLLRLAKAQGLTTEQAL